MFETLFEGGVIEVDVFEKLRKMNGLRNAIVHAYDSLIVEEIYDNYNEILKDISYVTDKLVSTL